LLARANQEQVRTSGGLAKISIDLGPRKIEEEKGGASMKIYTKDGIIIDDEN
jgi:hypothetical protein